MQTLNHMSAFPTGMSFCIRVNLMKPLEQSYVHKSQVIFHPISHYCNKSKHFTSVSFIVSSMLNGDSN